MPKRKKAAQRNTTTIAMPPRQSQPQSQPPLPAGLPPRPSQQLPARQSVPSPHARHGDSYPGSGESRRGYQAREDREVFEFGAGRSYRPSYEQRPRSPPRYTDYAPGVAPRYNDYAPGVSRNDNHRSYDGSNRDREHYQSNRPTQSSSFDFRYEAPAGLDYNAPDRYRPAPRNDNHKPAMRAANARGGARGGYRGRGGPRLAADRDFLKTNREPTPELMTGMDESVDSGAKYIAPDDVSDSEEEEMDISDNSDDEAQEPKKKQARTTGKAADADSVPRWSNPDPYTALPPPDESRGKKKDVVKLIRKARVTTSTDHAATAATTDDFISLDFGDEEPDEEPEPPGIGVQGAPTGPREMYRTANQVSTIKPANSNLPRGPATQNAPSLPANPNKGKAVGFEVKARVKANAAPANKQNVVDLTSDPVLGSRKRTFDDEIKNLSNIQMPPAVHDPNAGKPGRPSNGKLLPGWVRSPGSPAAPWLSIDHSDSAGMGVWQVDSSSEDAAIADVRHRLHKEIMDFYDYVKPRDFEQEIRLRLVEELRSKVKQHFHRDDEIQPFGSFPAGLYLPTADMDLVCISSEYTAQREKIFGQGLRGLRTFTQFLRTYKLPLADNVEMINGAKVPLVKYIDRLTGLKVDISFENTTGIVANTTFQNWKKEYPAMPILVTLIKHMLAMRGLNEPVNGGIGGFSVTCLVVSLLQNMPQVQSRNLVPEHHLGEILMEFLDLYGNQFNVVTTAITLDPPGYIPKNRVNRAYNKRNPNKFCIIDPNRSDNDIAGGSSNTTTIRKCFSEAYDALQHRMSELQRSENRKNQSLLECVIGGNYRSFELQRAHLAHVHQQLYG